jgi:outer membrane lipoprotein LolB
MKTMHFFNLLTVLSLRDQCRLGGLKVLSSLLMLLLLSACTAPNATMVSTPISTSKSAENLDAWDINGKIGMKSVVQNGSASLKWKQRPAGYNIDIVAPLGLATIRLSGSTSGVKLVSNDQEISTTNLQELEQKVEGVPIPFANLHYWIRGLPAKTSVPTNTTQHAAGYYQAFSQAGWELQFENYANNGGYVLPGKIIAKQGTNQLTIIIRQWGL